MKSKSIFEESDSSDDDNNMQEQLELPEIDEELLDDSGGGGEEGKAFSPDEGEDFFAPPATTPRSTQSVTAVDYDAFWTLKAS